MTMRLTQPHAKSIRVLITCLATALTGLASIAANAGPIVFDFEGQSTDITVIPTLNVTSPEVLNVLGGAGIGGTLSGNLSITDENLTDSCAGGEEDCFSVSLRYSIPSPPSPARDFGFVWQHGSFVRDSDFFGGRGSVLGGELILTDSAAGDSISLSISESGRNMDTINTLTIVFTDPTGTAFAGSGNLSGSYADAVSILREVDLSSFTEVSGTANGTLGRFTQRRETVEFSLSSFGVRAVPEPETAGLALLGLLLLGVRKRRSGSFIS